jgi:hypothetical protein
MRDRFAIALALGLALSWSPARAQEPEASNPPADPPLDRPVATTRKPASNVDAAEAAKARLFAIERLRALSEPQEKGKERDKASEARVTALREVFKSRERLILDWEKTVKARQAVLNTEPTPEGEAAELKTALERLKVGLSRAKTDPSSILPEPFRNTSTPKVDEALKDAVDDAQDAVENVSKELATQAASPGRKVSTPLAAAKAEREETRKRIAALGPRAVDAEAALGAASSAEGRELARERMVNLDWETKLEAERLREVEARIDLETRREAVSAVKVQVLNVKLELAKATDDLVKARYAEWLARKNAELDRAEAFEKARAEHEADPLERYKARRNQELSAQTKLFNAREAESKATPLVALAEQTARANKAAEDFEKLKKLVESGRSSALVAQRLNNSFRRLAAERGSISRNELAQVNGLLAKYEGELTAVELDLINDERGDRELRDALLASLPEGRWGDARKVFGETERAHRKMLEKRQAILTSLEEQTEKTRQEVMRRLRILDEQHAFVRTHLFWVRDAQPIGAASADQIRREGQDLGRTLLSIAAEPWSRSNWSRVSPEFVVATLGLFAFPYGLYRARKALRARIAAAPGLAA